MEEQLKKRKADNEGAALFAEENQGNLACELKGIKSAMKELLDHSRSQTMSMASMQHEMNDMKEEVKQMRSEMKNLSEKSDMLENANSRWFGEVDSRLKYHEVMLKNQKWEYSAPPPSSRYWRSVGHTEHDESYAGLEATDFLDQIKTNTCNMRYGKWPEGRHIISMSADVAYDAAFLPHWKEFADALMEHHHIIKWVAEKNAYGSSLYLADVELPREVTNLLSSALCLTHFQTLILKNNDFGRNGIEFALNCIEDNPILKKFVLGHNQIDEGEDFDRLCEIVKHHQSIETVHLVACKGGELCGFDMLRSIINAGSNKLKDIDFSDNAISTGGSTFISDFLGTNPILRNLELRGSQLNDDDATSIASALKCNTNLTHLDLDENPMITYVGWEALQKAMFDDTSLNSAADSNHTCHLIYPEEYIGIQQFNEESGDVKAVRSKKIFIALSSRNRNGSNIQHLTGVPIEILPEMLSSVQKYSDYHLSRCPDHNTPGRDNDDVTALSVVYEIMRKWDKALSVYESLSSCY